MTSDSSLDRLEEVIRPLLDREDVARTLAQEAPPGVMFVGLVGVELVDATYTILSELLVIRRVTNPPGVIHVCTASVPGRVDHLGVARYSSSITAELVAGRPDRDPREADARFLLSLAWHAVAMLKLAGATGIIAPVSATASWDTIASRKADVEFSLLDDVPRIRRTTSERRPFSTGEMDWIADHFVAGMAMRNAERSRRFGLAFNVAYSWNHTPDPRVALANLWVGIEALFGSRNDRPVTKALVRRIVEWLGPEQQDDVEELYDHRCDAVHGRWVDEGDLAAPIDQSWAILRSSLMLAIERTRAPLSDWAG